MCRSPLHDFIHGLPKCEHHVHLEGCLTPELLFQLAEKNKIALPDPATHPAYESVDTLNARYAEFTSLDDFLDFYFRAMSVLLHESDFADLAWAYFQKAHADGVHHAEVFFDPQVHHDRGVAYETLVSGVLTGCQRAEKELGLSTRLIPCFVRHLPLESATRLYDQVLASNHFEDGVLHGLGWSSTEVGPPKDMFREIYASAATKGIQLTAHAGEEGDSSYISTALELGARRIDHGIRLVEDAELMARVAREGILLTVCPLSNVRLRCVESLEQLPIRKFLDAGVKFSINSDDPAYFEGYILDNYCAVQEAFQLSVEEWRTISENSVDESWIDDARKVELRRRIDEHVQKHAAIV
ncbi:adenosine deaminase [Aspergillus clavatus NRRL 1]|uniref:Adenine deaminase n=1 Tax=Aspergillus clavatus (strain ATCC 1007 / CBS 513.65 / DSM 816 / NCTC 3887 / NRRL 1 / QM 1276 / 107) TaxID=344612 RepID=A1CSX5_ASPCL|nr:adenosine deaminase [Aspergillus clavatus NRRL 1]EAW06412.1 adenosine deaminase [Aspergillus clavatus NRRL 1]